MLMCLRLPGAALGILVSCYIPDCSSRRVDIEIVDDHSTDLEQDHEEVERPVDVPKISRNSSSSPTFTYPVAPERIGMQTVVAALESTPFADVHLNRTSWTVPATALANIDHASLAEQSQALVHGGNRTMHSERAGPSSMLELYQHVTGPKLFAILVAVLLSVCACSICMGLLEGHLKAKEREKQKAKEVERERDRIRRDKWQKVRKGLMTNVNEQSEDLLSDQALHSSGTDSQGKGWGKLRAIAAKGDHQRFQSPALDKSLSPAKDKVQYSDGKNQAAHSDGSDSRTPRDKVRAVAAKGKYERGGHDSGAYKSGDLSRGILAAFRNKHEEAARRVKAKNEEQEESDQRFRDVIAACRDKEEEGARTLMLKTRTLHDDAAKAKK